VSPPKWRFVGWTPVDYIGLFACTLSLRPGRRGTLRIEQIACARQRQRKSVRAAYSPASSGERGRGLGPLLVRVAVRSALANCLTAFYSCASVIRSFRSKALRDFFLDNNPRGIRADLVERVRGRLYALHRARSLDDLRIPGWRLHALHGKPARHAVAINGPWRMTFEWQEGDALRVDLEQYH